MVIVNCNYTSSHQKRGPGATRLVTVDDTGTSETVTDFTAVHTDCNIGVLVDSSFGVIQEGKALLLGAVHYGTEGGAQGRRHIAIRIVCSGTKGDDQGVL
ncbi:unnamed protein product [Sphagnum jensenii]|uniref:Uncharacterized protein n=1 Tax=Sphagnum jensenii TaxID=128206 RepID=A0ABP1ABN9_9BRYO